MWIRWRQGAAKARAWFRRSRMWERRSQDHGKRRGKSRDSRPGCVGSGSVRAPGGRKQWWEHDVDTVDEEGEDITVTGVAPANLDEADLERELAQLHRTRHETFLHGSTQALQHHSERTAELELEYLRRHPEREIDDQRLRDGVQPRGHRAG